MKPKDKGNFSFNIPGVKLYLEDLENIIKFISNEKIEISDENFKYDSLKELKQNGPKNLKELNINSNSPYISLQIKRKGFLSGANLYASSEGEFQLLKIKDLLLQKKQWHSFLSSSKLYFVGLAILAISIISASFLNKSSEYFSFISIIIITLFLFSLILISMHLAYGPIISPASINIFYSNEKQSFWDRNKDSIIVATFSALAGAVFGGIIVGLVMRHS
jgi:hypothetical protein